MDDESAVTWLNLNYQQSGHRPPDYEWHPSKGGFICYASYAGLASEGFGLNKRDAKEDAARDLRKQLNAQWDDTQRDDTQRDDTQRSGTQAPDYGAMLHIKKREVMKKYSSKGAESAFRTEPKSAFRAEPKSAKSVTARKVPPASGGLFDGPLPSAAPSAAPSMTPSAAPGSIRVSVGDTSQTFDIYQHAMALAYIASAHALKVPVRIQNADKKMKLMLYQAAAFDLVELDMVMYEA